MVEGGHKVQAIKYTVSPGEVMYRMVTTASNYVWFI